MKGAVTFGWKRVYGRGCAAKWHGPENGGSIRKGLESHCQGLQHYLIGGGAPPKEALTHALDVTVTRSRDCTAGRGHGKGVQRASLTKNVQSQSGPHFLAAPSPEENQATLKLPQNA